MLMYPYANYVHIKYVPTDTPTSHIYVDTTNVSAPLVYKLQTTLQHSEYIKFTLLIDY